MFKLQLNRALIRVAISPREPLLVRSGDVSADPSRPDLECVRTRHDLLGDTVYIPGSSLKGVLRSHAERILRTLEMNCCDPLEQNKNPCHEEAKRPGEMDKGDYKKVRTALQYKQCCTACRTFGSTRLAGRAAFADAMPWDTRISDVDRIREAAARANATERRTGVAIDRKTGATKRGALFDLEVVTGGTFHAEITLRNYQLWQLGLLGFVLRDLDEGHVRLGSSKSRGMGLVSARITELTLQEIRRPGDTPQRLQGVGSLSGALGDYGLSPDDAAERPAELDHAAAHPFFHTWTTADASAAEAVFRACAGAPWEAAVSHFNNPRGG